MEVVPGMDLRGEAADVGQQLLQERVLSVLRSGVDGVPAAEITQLHD